MRQGIEFDVESVMPAALATGLFSSTCTIQTPSTAVTGAGQWAGQFTNLAGHVNLRCMAPPLGDQQRIAAMERKSTGQVTDFTYLHILLEGYYPAIQPKMRAVIDGVNYDIAAVESDSQRQMTRMEVGQVTM